jgi:hypothetical protein
MSYEELPNVKYYGKPLYIKSSDKPPLEYNPGFDFMTNEYKIMQRNKPANSESVSISEGEFKEVPKGTDGQSENSPRTQFFKNIFKNRMRDNYQFFDENKNELGVIDDIGHDPQTRNDNYFFHNNNQMKGQDDVIYYKSITGGKRRSRTTKKRRGGKRRKTQRR